MKSISRLLCRGLGLAMVGLGCPGLAADPAPAEPSQPNYEFELQITPKDGSPQRYKVITAGERFQASYLAQGASVDEAEAPTILKFEAEFETLEPSKVWVRHFSVGQHVPVVTGTTRSGVVGPAREARALDAGAGPDAATGMPGERPRVADRRRVREPGEGADPQFGDGAPAGRGTSRGFGGPVGQIRQVQYMDVGLVSSVMLTFGKPVVVVEDSAQRIALTVRKLEN
jgi:hypothetical protein